MNRLASNSFIKTVFFLFILAFSFLLKAQEKPNIVMIFVDDWAWNGSSVQMDDEVVNSYFPSLIHMPNLDRIAAEGMTFSNAYAGAPQCSPSRVALQTGQSSPRNGFTVYMNDGGSDYYDHSKSYSQFPVLACVSDMTIDPGATTIPEALLPHGYASAHLGKWHMRGHPDDEGYVMNDGNTDNKAGNQEIPGNPKMMFSVTDSAIAFMEEQAGSDTPFYVQLSHYAMHEGRECLAATREKYQSMPELQDYYKSIGETASSISYKSDPAVWLGMAEDLDGRIGAVLDKLRGLGIEDNTYVIVTGDNGYRQGFYDELFRLPQPLHGHKWWLWQAGLRVAMLVKGPGIPAGSVCDENVVNYDFLPTFIDWAGGDPDTELTDIDGVSLASLMRGEAADPDFSNRSLYFHYPHYRETMPHSVVVSGDKKVVHFYEKPGIPMYFDIAGDIAEVSNLAEEDSAGHKALFDEMMQYLEDVGARIPLYPNPAYDSLVYISDDKYYKRVLWGPFAGDRPLEEDEYISGKEKLFQHLSALNRPSLLTDAMSVVTAWKDQTFRENNAIPGTGAAQFPSTGLFGSGLPGVDFGSTNTTLELFSSIASDALLDYNGAASGKNGFALSLVFMANSLENEWAYLAGNSLSPSSTNSFGIRYNGSGLIEAYLGGEILKCTKALSMQQTVALSVNYNSSTGLFGLYTSLGDTLSTIVATNDFSNADPLCLGGISAESAGFFNGVLGEVKVFDMALNEDQVFSETNEMYVNWTEPGEQKLMQHLDASVEGSVLKDESGLVSTWMDLSGNENHASPLAGLYYPAPGKSATGLSGVDFGDANNKLELFSSEESDAFLDFTGMAAKNDGLTILLAFKIDSILGNQNDIMGNSTSVGAGLGMRYDDSGKPRAYTGGTKINLVSQLHKGETVVYALKYDKSKQLLKFWNSSTQLSETRNLAPGDFSTGSPFTLGACDGASRFLVGMVGEVKTYNYSLSEAEFEQQCKYLADKWINGKPSAVSWVQDPFSKSNAFVDSTYADSITHTDLDNPDNIAVLFSKISGPAWLSISESGVLSGTPSEADLGGNTFMVQAAYESNTGVQASLAIEVLSNTSVGVNFNSAALMVYPNPVPDILYIEGTGTGFYEIYDIIGMKLMEGNHEGSVNVSRLKNGLYVLNVNEQVLRFVKN